ADQELRGPAQAAGAGSQRRQRHRVQRGRCRHLCESHGDEQPPIRRRQPEEPRARQTWTDPHAASSTNTSLAEPERRFADTLSEIRYAPSVPTAARPRSLVAASIVVIAAAAALAQVGGGGGGLGCGGLGAFGFGGGVRLQVLPNARYDGRFTFVRVNYESAPGGYWYRGLPAW